MDLSMNDMVRALAIRSRHSARCRDRVRDAASAFGTVRSRVRERQIEEARAPRWTDLAL
jgi:hypothetical protein